MPFNDFLPLTPFKANNTRTVLIEMFSSLVRSGVLYNVFSLDTVKHWEKKREELGHE